MPDRFLRHAPDEHSLLSTGRLRLVYCVPISQCPIGGWRSGAGTADGRVRVATTKLFSGAGSCHGNLPENNAAKLRLGSRAERKMRPPMMRCFAAIGITMYLSIVSSPMIHAVPISGVTIKSVQPVF